MNRLRIAVAVIFFSGIAQAQTPGVGETRPADPAARERSGPADDAIKGSVIKEREPADRTTVIKKEDEFGNREKTVIHHDND